MLFSTGHEATAMPIYRLDAEIELFAASVNQNMATTIMLQSLSWQVS